MIQIFKHQQNCRVSKGMFLLCKTTDYYYKLILLAIHKTNRRSIISEYVMIWTKLP